MLHLAASMSESGGGGGADAAARRGRRRPPSTPCGNWSATPQPVPRARPSVPRRWTSASTTSCCPRRATQPVAGSAAGGLPMTTKPRCRGQRLRTPEPEFPCRLSVAGTPESIGMTTRRDAAPAQPEPHRGDLRRHRAQSQQSQPDPRGLSLRAGRPGVRVAPSDAWSAICSESSLPREKTFATLQLDRFSPALQLQIERLRTGAFVEDAVNVVAVGRPGVGKSHVAAALGPRAHPAGSPGALDHDRGAGPAPAGRQARPAPAARAGQAGPASPASSSTTSAMCSTTATRWRCSLPCWRSATSGAA